MLLRGEEETTFEAEYMSVPQGICPPKSNPGTSNNGICLLGGTCVAERRRYAYIATSCSRFQK